MFWVFRPLDGAKWLRLSDVPLAGSWSKQTQRVETVERKQNILKPPNLIDIYQCGVNKDPAPQFSKMILWLHEGSVAYAVSVMCMVVMPYNYSLNFMKKLSWIKVGLADVCQMLRMIKLY